MTEENLFVGSALVKLQLPGDAQGEGFSRESQGIEDEGWETGPS